MAQSEGWSRRGFLTARGLGASTGGAIAAMLPPVNLCPPDDRSVHHWVVSRRAMACDFSVHLHPLVKEPVAVAEAALKEVEQLEDVLSAYRADSELSRVNHNAFDRPVRTDARLFGLLQRAAELYQQTDGAFDAATGAIIKTWGFFERAPRLPAPGEIEAAMRRCGMKHVELDAEEMTVRYRAAGLEINLGSIGKGYAIDRAMQVLRRDHGIDCALVGGGTSSMSAVGSLWGDDTGWLIGVEDPADPTRHVATVRLKDRAMGTSSASNQYFEADGKRYGHLLDPRTGCPADELASASVLAPDAATADALATAFFVAGLDKAAEFCHNRRNIAALLVLKESPGSAGKLPDSLSRLSSVRGDARVVTFNLPPNEVSINKTARG